MAGLDGIRNKIEPPAPIDKDLYDLPPEEVAQVTQVPGSLPEVLDALEEDHELPARGWRLHPRPDRDLDRLQAGQRDRPGPPAARPRTSSPCTTTSDLHHQFVRRQRGPRFGNQPTGALCADRLTRP